MSERSERAKRHSSLRSCAPPAAGEEPRMSERSERAKRHSGLRSCAPPAAGEESRMSERSGGPGGPGFTRSTEEAA
ncbi:hypothetical protein Ppa05_22470 [Planomonospora parontospora subsp. antibiotica]|nr:hypothetical protein Ppa05_22470 [Planomonospora parontospora subsp. antibiotica]